MKAMLPGPLREPKQETRGIQTSVLGKAWSLEPGDMGSDLRFTTYWLCDPGQGAHPL